MPDNTVKKENTGCLWVALEKGNNDVYIYAHKIPLNDGDVFLL